MPEQMLPPLQVITAGPYDPNHAYYQNLCAQLEPDALEAPLANAFSYSVGAGVTKYVVMAWNTYLAGDTNARYDVRMGGQYLPLRNVALAGAGTNSMALVLDTTLPTYANARNTYFDRLQAIRNLDTKVVSNAGGSSNNFTTFLPGPYGAIITSTMIFDYAWPGLMANHVASGAWPIEYETSDSGSLPARFQHIMNMPITKASTGAFETGWPANGNARGALTYVILPSTWSAITDPLAPYSFRDDFMGATLDTTTNWNRAQSTVGNVEINTHFQWCKAIGNSSWGANGLYTKTSWARSAGKKMVVDVNVGLGAVSDVGMFGWMDGGGYANSNSVHCLNFRSTGNIEVYEGGTNRGAVGTFGSGYTYRLRITCNAGNTGTYEIQGGTYPAIGGSSWTTLTPGVTSNSTTPVYAGGAFFAANCHFGDVRVY